MSLNEIVSNVTMLCASFTVGLNIRTYFDTKDWLDTHNVDNSWNEKTYEHLKKSNSRGYITYYLGMPGRKIAYSLNQKNKE